MTIGIIIACLIVFSASAFFFTSKEKGFEVSDREGGLLGVASGLFTLLGGGEIATLVTLSFLFGLDAIFLFLGYALGFLFLARFAAHIKSYESGNSVTNLHEYIGLRYGRTAKLIAGFISTLAFSALLLLQFTVGASLLAELSGASYSILVLLMAITVGFYLFTRGFSAVLFTDRLQGIAMFVLSVALISLSLFQSEGFSFEAHTPMPGFLKLSLLFTGVFVAVGSADVWQRIYSASSVVNAQRGLIVGGLMLLLLSSPFIIAGYQLNALGVSLDDPNNALFSYFSLFGSDAISYIGVALILTAVVSTADTEVFLVSSILHDLLPKAKRNRLTSGLSILLVAFMATIAAMIFTDAVAIYTWLLLLILCLSPTVVVGFFTRPHKFAVTSGMILTTLLFFVFAWLGMINFDNAFLIFFLGLFLLLAGVLVTKLTKNDKA